MRKKSFGKNEVGIFFLKFLFGDRMVASLYKK